MSMEVIDLKFRYRERSVLNGITFQAQGGESLFVLGPNGAGKSTLFKCILGLLRGFSGRIRVDGLDLRQYTTEQLARKIAYIPQSHDAHFAYTALEIVLMGTAPRTGLFSTPGSAQVSEALRALQLLGVGHMQGRAFGKLSGGERQLVLIARAIAQGAGMLVMDEPTANLDYGNQTRVMEEIGRLTGEGYSILLSSHNPQHAFLYADRVLALKDGNVVGVGTPGDILSEELLESLYGVPIKLRDIPFGQRDMRVCMPGE